MDFKTFCAETGRLADIILAADFRPDFIIGIARGGWIPARLLSSFLNVKEILSIGIKYKDELRAEMICFSKPNPMPENKKILLVEDCLESGKSIEYAKQLFLSAGNKVKTSALYVLDTTIHKADFYIDTLKSVPEFPWEQELVVKNK